MRYRVGIHPAAQKQILALPREAQATIALSIDELATTPRPPRVKKLAGSDLWRIRVGQYRIVYSIEDDDRLVIIVRVVRRRENSYKGL